MPAPLAMDLRVRVMGDLESGMTVSVKTLWTALRNWNIVWKKSCRRPDRTVRTSQKSVAGGTFS